MKTAISPSDFKETFLGQANINLESMQLELRSPGYPAKKAKNYLAQASTCLDAMYCAGKNIRMIIELKAWFMDQVLSALWARYNFAPQELALLAVGGYGRGELQPFSDIDLLILVETDISPELGESISSFVTLLWDLSLDIGHSVRSIDECITAAKEDVTIATNLLETRIISGDNALRTSLTKRIYSNEVYTSKDYFMAKFDEQAQRHKKYSGTEYNLEPNIKASPGTLRDIQTVGWITKRHFGPDSESSRERYHFLTDEEFNLLLSGETFLWKLRYGLQMVAKRNENRLLFDYQRKLAGILGYKDNKKALGVERMMQRYYRKVLALGELADLILQYFDDFYLNPEKKEEIVQLNNRFRTYNG
jgi:[protein-PII] uridylyltransferase